MLELDPLTCVKCSTRKLARKMLNLPSPTQLTHNLACIQGTHPPDRQHDFNTSPCHVRSHHHSGQFGFVSGQWLLCHWVQVWHFSLIVLALGWFGCELHHFTVCVLHFGGGSGSRAERVRIAWHGQSSSVRAHILTFFATDENVTMRCVT